MTNYISVLRQTWCRRAYPRKIMRSNFASPRSCATFRFYFLLFLHQPGAKHFGVASLRPPAPKFWKILSPRWSPHWLPNCLRQPQITSVQLSSWHGSAVEETSNALCCVKRKLVFFKLGTENDEICLVLADRLASPAVNSLPAKGFKPFPKFW